MKRIFIFWLFFMLVCATCANASLVSTFNYDDEGWHPGNDVTLSWQSSGGNPGGFLQGDDWGDGRVWYYVSPVSWTGNWSPYIGYTLSFDLKIIDRGTPTVYDYATVRIYGSDGDVMDWYADDPGNSWTHYELVLNASTFGESESYFEGIMSDVTELWIRGEYGGTFDIEGLDNVVVTPIPGALYLFSSGLLGLVALKKRRVKL